MATKALWFSKLSILADTLEGMTPELTRPQMKSQHRDMEEWFPDEERKQQVRRFVEVTRKMGESLLSPTVGLSASKNLKKCGMSMSEMTKAWPFEVPLNVWLTPYACLTSVGGWAG